MLEWENIFVLCIYWRFEHGILSRNTRLQLRILVETESHVLISSLCIKTTYVVPWLDIYKDITCILQSNSISYSTLRSIR